jgi:16S rRNA (uracil1498-N3)-methyltransferase
MRPAQGAPAHVFVDDLSDLRLSADDRHHLERVLRLRPGDVLTVSDGAGGRRRCRFGPALEPVGDIELVDPPRPLVTVAFAPAKGDRPEWAVQKLTEVGVDRIVVLATRRSVVRWEGSRAAGRVERLRRVAREAAMQSRRVHLPLVEGLRTFTEVAAEPGAALADLGGEPPSLDRPVLLVGPEGGWEDEERAAPLPRVALGPHVLRAETAAVAAGVLLCALRQGLVRPGGYN